MEDFWKALLAFGFNVLLFALAFLATWVAWNRDSNYKLRMTAAQDCLVAYYLLAESYDIALRGPTTSHDEQAGKVGLGSSVIERQEKLSADALQNLRSFAWKLRTANLYIDMQNYNIRKSPLTLLALQEHIEEMLRYATYLRSVDAKNVSLDQKEYEYTLRRVSAELRPEDAGIQNEVDKTRDRLEALLIPYTQPRQVFNWLSWIPLASP